MGTGELTFGCNGLASHPGGSRNTPSGFMLLKPEISAGLMGYLARLQTLQQGVSLVQDALIVTLLNNSEESEFSSYLPFLFILVSK